MEKYHQRKSLRQKLVVGAIAIAAVAGLYYGVIRSKRPRPATAPPAKVQQLDQKVESEARHLKETYVPRSPDYKDTVQATILGLGEHPREANELVRESITSLQKSGARIDPETYVAMFNSIKEKAEENPAITDHFGPNAREYQRRRVLDAYAKEIEKQVEIGVREAYKKAVEAGKSLADSDFVQRVLQEIKDLGDSVLKYEKKDKQGD